MSVREVIVRQITQEVQFRETSGGPECGALAVLAVDFEGKASISTLTLLPLKAEVKEVKYGSQLFTASFSRYGDGWAAVFPRLNPGNYEVTTIFKKLKASYDPKDKQTVSVFSGNVAIVDYTDYRRLPGYDSMYKAIGS